MLEEPALEYTALTEPASTILSWYDRHRRIMPWRAVSNDIVDPYRVWLSEIMLQQTTVVTVGPYFERFVARWPTVHDLANAELDDVLHAWQGLGYYARARNMHKCARAVVADHDGRFPDTETELRALPGIGAYTAAAVTAIAFGRRAVVMDGNVERVMARLFAVHEPLPRVKPQLYALADQLTPEARSGDYAQAVMDLGATICTPRAPKCLLCPWAHQCKGRDVAESLPQRVPKGDKPTRRGAVFWLTDSTGAVLLRRRRESGLLGGMMEAPSTPWSEGPSPEWEDAWRHAPIAVDNRLASPGVVRHGFTHFHLELVVFTGQADATTAAPPGATWCPINRLGEHALPTLMRKVAAHVLSAPAGTLPASD